MWSFALVYAFVAVLNCGIAVHWYGNDYDELRPHDGEVTGCNREKAMQLSKQMKDVKCMPRDTMVRLVSQLGFTFYPNYARVKRCGGFCTRSKSCMPVAVNFTKVAVRMHGYNTKECYNVLVEQHTKCKCQCSVKEQHCNPNQQYSEENCACECMNRVDCDRSRKMIWDEKMCKCTCTKDSEEDCSSGLEWIPSRCRCAKVMDDYEN